MMKKKNKLHAINDYHIYNTNVNFKYQLKPHLYHNFIEYLYSSKLIINIYDADRLFNIGEGILPLKPFLRQGNIAIQKAALIDIISQPFYGGSIKNSKQNHHHHHHYD